MVQLQVSYICKRTVVSTNPVEPGKFIPLSVLDRVMERNNLRVVFYYRSLPGKKPGELIKKLRESASEMLSDFPIILGRLLRNPEGHWAIKCNDAGLRMVEARVNGTVDDWLRSVDSEKELKYLVHWEAMSRKPYFWATFYVQVTEFEGGGLAIGLSCTHLLSDPICATMIIRSWAETTFHGKIKTPSLFTPLPTRRYGDHEPSLRLIDHYKSAMENTAPASDAKKATITLQFNHEMVLRCIDMTEKPSSDEIIGLNLTPFEALSALFWTSISKIKGSKRGLVDMSICSDTRKLLDLDMGFFGNCMVYSKISGDGLHEKDAARAIKEAVSKIDKDAVMGLIEWLERENFGCDPPSMNGSGLICLNLEDVGSHYAMFEGGKSPIRTSYHLEPDFGLGQITILPSPGNEGSLGRVVMVRLALDEVEKLLEDSLVKQFYPTLLMGLN